MLVYLYFLSIVAGITPGSADTRHTRSGTSMEGRPLPALPERFL
jgi:hypothetical protein